MNDAIVIEPIRESDIAACTEIYNYYILNTCYTLEEQALKTADFAARVARISANYPYLVARNSEGRVLGYVYLSAFNERSAYRRTVDLSIYTDHAVSGKGVGSALLAAVEKEAQRRGFAHMVSLITAENAGSVAFHQKHGFQKAGELQDVAFKFGRSVGVCFYLKAI